jgi:hypothetical protein
MAAMNTLYKYLQYVCQVLAGIHNLIRPNVCPFFKRTFRNEHWVLLGQGKKRKYIWLKKTEAKAAKLF